MSTDGALVQGGYGHSSVFDPSTRAIYIHGGYKAFSANKYGLAGDLYKFDVGKRKWWEIFCFVMKYACLNATVAGFSHMYCTSDHTQHSYVRECKQLDRKYAVKLQPPEYKVGMMWMCGCVKIPGSSLEHLQLANVHDVSCLCARFTAKVF